MSHAFIICNHFNLLFLLQGGQSPVFLFVILNDSEGSPSSLIAKTRSSGFATPKLILSGF